MDWSKIRPTAIIMALLAIAAAVLEAPELAYILAGPAGTLCVDGAPPTVPADTHERMMQLGWQAMKAV